MKIICRTNLDLRGEEWPSELPAAPRVGDYIQSATGRKYNPTKDSFPFNGPIHLELQVVACKWKYHKSLYVREGGWILEVELHLPKNRFESISDFEEWYDRLF